MSACTGLDVAPNFSASQMALMHGGEVSMWNNHWCYFGECHSTKGERPCAWWMSGYDPQCECTASWMLLA